MAPPSPDAYNWTQFTDTMPDGVHDRMDRAVAFYFAGLGEEHRQAVEDARRGGGEVDLLPFVTPDERKILEEIEDRTGRRPHLVVAEVGRGAGG